MINLLTSAVITSAANSLTADAAVVLGSPGGGGNSADAVAVLGSPGGGGGTGFLEKKAHAEEPANKKARIGAREMFTKWAKGGCGEMKVEEGVTQGWENGQCINEITGDFKNPTPEEIQLALSEDGPGYIR